jgi:hypothetical protein
MPELIVREGSTRDEVLKLLKEDKDIRILVLAAATEKDGPGPLVSALADDMAAGFPVPVTVVPGNLTEEEIDSLT